MRQLSDAYSYDYLLHRHVDKGAPLKDKHAPKDDDEETPGEKEKPKDDNNETPGEKKNHVAEDTPEKVDQENKTPKALFPDSPSRRVRGKSSGAWKAESLDLLEGRGKTRSMQEALGQGRQGDESSKADKGETDKKEHKADDKQNDDSEKGKEDPKNEVEDVSKGQEPPEQDDGETQPSEPGKHKGGGAGCNSLAKYTYDISPELAQLVQKATKASEVPDADRKRLYSAMNRAIEKFKDQIPGPVLARWAEDADKKETFQFLKEWVADPSFGNIVVFERHYKSSSQFKSTEYGWYTGHPGEVDNLNCPE